MKKSIFPAFLSLFAAQSSGQVQPKPVLNHIAHYVVNLQINTAFYQHIIGLDTIPEPFQDGKHTWFSIGPRIHLHLIEGAAAISMHDKNNHLCFTVPSVETFTKKLIKNGIAWENWAGEPSGITNRVDGVKQIYFRDPEGYWIEVNDAKE